MAEQQKGNSLAVKMAKVMAAVHRIPKTGYNSFHNYKFATEADVAELIRELLADNGVAFLPSVVPGSIERFEVPGNKGANFVTRLWLSVKFVDGDSGEVLESTWPGEGQDNGDKGCYKAITGAEKYALMKTFLIPTGDDPENENDTERGASSKRTNQERQTTQSERQAAPPPSSRPHPTTTGVDAAAPEEQPQRPPHLISEAQLNRLHAIVNAKGWTKEDAKAIIAAAGFSSSKDITKAKYDAICKVLEAGPQAKEPAHAG
jgi:hypothetical protein